MSVGPAAPVVVRELDDSAVGAWDAFVEACPQATFFHRSGWRQIFERCLGHRCRFLMAETDGQLRGVLPLVHVKGRFFGEALVSTGFLVQGGPAATDPVACEALDRAAIALATELGVGHLEYRLQAPMHADWACTSSLYFSFRKTMSAEVDVNLKAVPRKQRAVVRKGLAAGLDTAVDADVDRFYRVFSESYRDLGTPVLSKRYFAMIMDVLAPNVEIVTVSRQGKPLCSVMVFLHRDQVMPYFGGGIRAARQHAAFDLMYWETMKRGCERGFRVFDFGRSKHGAGSYEYKRHWGFEPQPLYYEYKLIKRRDLPELNTQNPRFAKAIALWRKLPLPIANRLGPFIARELA